MELALATQDYGSHIDRLGKPMGEENAYSFGSERNALRVKTSTIN